MTATAFVGEASGAGLIFGAVVNQFTPEQHAIVAQGEVGDALKRAAMRPVREANGVAAGISAAVSTFVKGRKYPPDMATQDEEMFI